MLEGGEAALHVLSRGLLHLQASDCGEESGGI